MRKRVCKYYSIYVYPESTGRFKKVPKCLKFWKYISNDCCDDCKYYEPRTTQDYPVLIPQKYVEDFFNLYYALRSRKVKALLNSISNKVEELKEFISSLNGRALNEIEVKQSG